MRDEADVEGSFYIRSRIYYVTMIKLQVFIHECIVNWTNYTKNPTLSIHKDISCFELLLEPCGHVTS